MKSIYEIKDGNILLQTEIPILKILDLRINCRENKHGRIAVKGIIAPDSQDAVLGKDWTDTPITAVNKAADNKVIFSGNIERMDCRMEAKVLVIVVYGIDHTAELDRKKEKCSYQKIGMKYLEICRNVMRRYQNGKIIWNIKEDQMIGEPILQYDETDWQFLIRLGSHLHQPVIADSESAGNDVHIGLPRGIQRKQGEYEICKLGVDETYYRDGCFEAGWAKGDAFYIEIKTLEDWNIGDAYLYNGDSYRVYRKKAEFIHGELMYLYRLGKQGIYYQRKKYNPMLPGCRLEGTIRGVQEESVYIQLDIDQEERADYLWQWAPETNNLSYCMPEIGTKATLYFATAEEKEGRVIYAVVHNRQMDRYINPQQREFITAFGKKIGLYENKFFLEGRDKASYWEILDETGMNLQTCHDCILNAEGEINCIAKKISVQSPVKLVCMTRQANIELCRDINLYAVNGVNTVGTSETSAVKSKETEHVAYNDMNEHWEQSFTALAAVPALNHKQDREAEAISDLCVSGAIPQVATGPAVVALSQVMEGTKVSECTFPNVFKAMGAYTVKGGYAVPREKT